MNKIPMSAWMSVALLAGLLSQPVAVVVGAEAGSAMDAVRGTIDRAFEVLNDVSLKAPERADERVATLERIVGQRFDYREMSRRTMGAHWGTLDEARQQEFVDLFRQFLLHTYVGSIDGYAADQIHYLKERRKGNFAEVRTAIRSSEVTLAVHYRLLKRSTTWKVYDVVVDGVSIVKNFRGQFARTIKTTSMDGLFEALRKKLGGSPSS